MFGILLVAIIAVHLDLERRIWIMRQDDIFAKYRDASTPPLTAAKWAYYTKAVWLISLILMQAFGMEFRSAVVFSFLLYAVLIQILLPFRVYNLLNLLLALGCLADWWLRRP